MAASHLSSRMESVIAALDLASRANPPTEIEDPTRVTPFHSSVPPPVPLVKYAERIAIYSGYGENGLALGLALIARFVDLRTVPLNTLTVHRILLTAVTVAGKAHMDFFVNNKYMSLVGGIPLHEINALEAWFLAGLAFEAIPTASEVARMTRELIECVAGPFEVDPAVADVTNPVICRCAFERILLIGAEEKAVRRRRVEAGSSRADSAAPGTDAA